MDSKELLDFLNDFPDLYTMLLVLESGKTSEEDLRGMCFDALALLNRKHRQAHGTYGLPGGERYSNALRKIA